MDVIIYRILFLVLLCAGNTGNAQGVVYLNDWVSVGPNNMPSNEKFRGDAGVGPIEFIRVYEKKEGHVLAGSLSGGLFYSENGGDSWSNSGSDDWDYSGCAWADFHPENEKTWFACSNLKDNNGKPGPLGEKGGVMRTTNGGEKWELIGDYEDFGGTKSMRVYGTRFDPEDTKTMFALTSKGLFYTVNCLSLSVKWERVPDVNGWVYDLAFFNDEIYLTNFYHGKWRVYNLDKKDYTLIRSLPDLEKDERIMRNLTIEVKGDELLIAKDMLDVSDELCLYNIESDTTTILLKNQKIGFGSGNTLAVSPHNTDLFFMGYYTRVHKWEPPYKKKSVINSRYHVDIEFVAFDPFDSLKIYLATHGGIFVSPDNGTSWESKNVNLGVSEVMGLSVSKTNPSKVAIGCYHDGSMMFADFENNESPTWRTINGGDGLLPLIHPTDENIVYTSNQYTGGGLFYSSDSVKKTNLHKLNKITSSGWEMAAVLDKFNPNTVYYNFIEGNGVNKGNINVCRSVDPIAGNKVEILSDFLVSHKLKKYKVYGLFNSPYHANVMLAYVLDYETDQEGNKITNHRIFRTDELDGSPEEIKKSWYELKHPNNKWVADVEIDGYNKNKIYLSYMEGNKSPRSIFGDRGMVYVLDYKGDDSHKLKSRIDISKNVPSSVAGRYNLAYIKQGAALNGGALFMVTQTGVYYARGRALRGKQRWFLVGKGLPHCKAYGIDYNEAHKIITVGLFGRGVWQYSLKIN